MVSTTTTRERPMNVSAWEVRAIMDGRKTQTRRMVNYLPRLGKVTCIGGSETTGYDFCLRDKRDMWNEFREDELLKLCPFGQPGDHLFGREKFCDRAEYGSIATSRQVRIVYAADGTEKREGWKWRPSTQMPRWASRIDLRIKSVRIERLQEISEADAIAEGARPLPLQSADDPSAWWEIDFGQHQCRTPRGVIRSLWQSSWDANPWVWVIEHERVT